MGNVGKSFNISPKDLPVAPACSFYCKGIAENVKEQWDQCADKKDHILFSFFSCIHKCCRTGCQYHNNCINRAVGTGCPQYDQTWKQHKYRFVPFSLLPPVISVEKDLVIIKAGKGKEMGPATSICQHLPFVQTEHNDHEGDKPFYIYLQLTGICCKTPGCKTDAYSA